MQNSFRWDGRITLLALGAFAIGTDAFVIAGLLPNLAATYDVSISAAGQLVTAYGLSFAIFSPILAAFTCHLARTKVLVVGLLLFALANLAGACSTDFVTALSARAIAGVGAGLFTPAASAVAASLVGPSQKNRALATIMLGLSSATAIGAPLGIFLADFIGWRVILISIAMLSAIIAFAITGRFLDLGPLPVLLLSDRIRALKNQRVALTLVSTFLVLTGLYVTYTYSSVVFATATNDQSANLAVLLSIWGVGATIGSYLGRAADKYGNRLVINAAVCALVLDFGFIYFAGTTFYGAAIGVAVWGVCGWAFVIPQQHRLISAASAMAPVLVALHLTAVYAGTSTAAVLGALALQSSGPNILPLLSAGLVLAGWATSELLFVRESPFKFGFKFKRQMSRSSAFRQNAENCVKLALSLFQADQRARWLEMAQFWLQRAEDTERQPPHVAQHQQQPNNSNPSWTNRPPQLEALHHDQWQTDPRRAGASRSRSARTR